MTAHTNKRGWIMEIVEHQQGGISYWAIRVTEPNRSYNEDWPILDRARVESSMHKRVERYSWQPITKGDGD